MRPILGRILAAVNLLGGGDAAAPFYKQPAFWKRIGPVLALGAAGAAASYGVPLGQDQFLEVGAFLLRAIGWLP